MKVSLWQEVLRDDSAQDLVEYALVAALIALGSVAAMNGIATSISSVFSAVTSNIDSGVRGRH